MVPPEVKTGGADIDLNGQIRLFERLHDRHRPGAVREAGDDVGGGDGRDVFGWMIRKEGLPGYVDHAKGFADFSRRFPFGHAPYREGGKGGQHQHDGDDD